MTKYTTRTIEVKDGGIYNFEFKLVTESGKTYYVSPVVSTKRGRKTKLAFNPETGDIECTNRLFKVVSGDYYEVLDEPKKENIQNSSEENVPLNEKDGESES